MFNIAASAKRTRELEKVLSAGQVADGLHTLQERQAKSAFSPPTPFGGMNLANELNSAEKHLTFLRFHGLV